MWACSDWAECGAAPTSGIVVEVPPGSGRARYIRLRSGSGIADGWVRFLEVCISVFFSNV